MMTALLHGMVLGLVQGVTEFFPVSSSGHLILVPALLGWPDQGIAFDTVLHLGTLVALICAFWKDLVDLAKRAFIKQERDARRLILQVCVAALPGLILGGLFGDMLESALRGPVPVAINLAFWALVLLAADRFSAKRREATTDVKNVTWRQALAVGISQALALSPGTSRSGITMTSGLLSGLDRATAVTFSFYVSIPTIAAAGAYGLFKLVRHPELAGSGGASLFAGFIVAAVVGTWAIRFLRSYVSKHAFDVFIWYRLALAIVVLAVVR